MILLKTAKNFSSILLISLFLFSGCVPSSFEQRVRRLESSLNDIRSLEAEHNSQLSDLHHELRQLTGKTEELEYSTNQKYGTDLDALKQDLSSLKRRVPPPANVPVQPLEEDEAISAKIGARQWSEGLLRLRAGNYTDALPVLQESQGLVGAEFLANIFFWIGVTYDGMSDYKNALSTYNELVTKAPRSKRAPLTLIRLASVFEKLGDGKASQFTLQKLVHDYPDSPEAISMKSKLGIGSQGSSSQVTAGATKKTKK